jgi:hypothetical protein
VKSQVSNTEGGLAIKVVTESTRMFVKRKEEGKKKERRRKEERKASSYFFSIIALLR